MTMVDCVFCHNSAHCGVGMAITYEGYEVEGGYLPEVGLCSECAGEIFRDKAKELLSEEEFNRAKEAVSKAFEEELKEQVEDRENKEVVMTNGASKEKEMAKRLKKDVVVIGPGIAPEI